MTSHFCIEAEVLSCHIQPPLNILSNTLLPPRVSLAAISLILDLKCYDVRPLLLNGLVTLLRPTNKVQHHLEGDTLVLKGHPC